MPYEGDVLLIVCLGCVSSKMEAPKMMLCAWPELWYIHSVSGGDGYLEKDPPSPDTPVSLHWEGGTRLPPGRGWLGAWPLQAR